MTRTSRRRHLYRIGAAAGTLIGLVVADAQPVLAHGLIENYLRSIL